MEERVKLLWIAVLATTLSACTIVIGSGDSEKGEPSGEGLEDAAGDVEDPYVQTSYSTYGQQDPQQPAEDTQCLSAGTVCSLIDDTDKPCCDGSYCDPLLADASELGACAALIEDGGPCWTGEVCAGGYCIDQVCTSTCSAIGGVCDFNGGCCEGSLCSIELNFSYGPGECLPPQANGEYCWLDDHCGSGHCVDQLCASEPGPLSAGESGCFANADCAEGLFCDDVGAYVAGVCTAPLPDGEYCWLGDQCASGTCHDDTCTSQCLDEGAWCERGVDACCGATVCFDQGYGFGACESPQPAGSFCLNYDECASGWCDMTTYTCG
jgi:hypothetical protein